MEIKGKFYPSTEKLLLGSVKESDLYDYISHGFALVDKDAEEKYFSYCWGKPIISIPKTPETEEWFRQKAENKSNLSDLIHLLTRLKHIQVHYGNNITSWDKVEKEMEKDEYQEAIANFGVTIGYLKGRMFPNE